MTLCSCGPSSRSALSPGKQFRVGFSCLHNSPYVRPPAPYASPHPTMAISPCSCLGHNSWIGALEFDPLHCVIPENDPSRAAGSSPSSNYRFLSVAQDGRLCFWDLNDGNLFLSRKRSGAPRRSSAASWNEAAARSAYNNVAELRPEDVPSMEPIYNALINPEPLTALHVAPSAIITATFAGESRIWARPTGPSTVGDLDED